MKITLLLEYSDRSQLRAWLHEFSHTLTWSKKLSASDGLTAHLRDFLMVAWHNVSPLDARRVIGQNSTWTAASILKTED